MTSFSVSLRATVDDADDWAQVWDRFVLFSKSVIELTPDVYVSSSLPDDDALDDEYYDEYTAIKAQDAVKRSLEATGAGGVLDIDSTVRDIILEMRHAGILLRERNSSS